jgi:integrase
MNRLRRALADYLCVRRALGYELRHDEKLLEQFLTYLEELGEEHVTAKTALDWATLPRRADRSWWSLRLTIVRGFATHLHAIDPVNEVPPPDLLPWKRRRATPYLYADKEIVAVITAAKTLRTPHQVATYQTLTGLLAVTGMRVGEAIGLDLADFDSDNGLVVVRKGKFGKSRELPLHPTTVDALRDYLNRRDRPRSATSSSALFVSSAGTRLLYCSVQRTFHRLTLLAGLEPRSPRCRPRLHDLRHSYALRTILDGYRDEGDTQARLALLSTYLGHVDPSSTYWYLSAAPELLELAGARLQQHLGGGQ